MASNNKPGNQDLTNPPALDHDTSNPLLQGNHDDKVKLLVKYVNYARNLILTKRLASKTNKSGKENDEEAGGVNQQSSALDGEKSRKQTNMAGQVNFDFIQALTSSPFDFSSQVFDSESLTVDQNDVFATDDQLSRAVTTLPSCNGFSFTNKQQSGSVSTDESALWKDSTSTDLNEFMTVPHQQHQSLNNTMVGGFQSVSNKSRSSKTKSKARFSSELDNGSLVPAKVSRGHSSNDVHQYTHSNDHRILKKSYSTPWGNQNGDNSLLNTLQGPSHINGERTINPSTSPMKYSKLSSEKFIPTLTGHTLSISPSLDSVSQIQPKYSSGISGITQETSETGDQNSNNVKSMRYNKTAEALKKSGLMDVTMKTAELLQKNRSLQKQIDSLRKESLSFLQSVLQNPENEGIREKISKSLLKV